MMRFRLANHGSDTEKDVVVVAPRFLKELKDLPDDVLSFAGAIEDVSLTPPGRHQRHVAQTI